MARALLASLLREWQLGCSLQRQCGLVAMHASVDMACSAHVIGLQAGRSAAWQLGMHACYKLRTAEPLGATIRTE
jgi:hypothetical protein